MRTIISPNSESERIIGRLAGLKLGQDLFELGGIGVLAREDNGIFKLRGGFQGFDAGFVNGFGFFYGFEADFEAGFDGGDVGLEPDEGRSIAGGAQDFVQFAAIALGGVAAFQDEGGTGFSDLADEQQNQGAREAVFTLQSVKIIERGVKLICELLGECGFTTTGGAENEDGAGTVAAVFLLTFHKLPPL